jgi:hypothetical protein
VDTDLATKSTLWKGQEIQSPLRSMIENKLTVEIKPKRLAHFFKLKIKCNANVALTYVALLWSARDIETTFESNNILKVSQLRSSALVKLAEFARDTIGTAPNLINSSTISTRRHYANIQ